MPRFGEIHGMVKEYQVERVKDVLEKGIDPTLVFEVDRAKPETPVVPEKPATVFRPKPAPPAEKPAPAEKPVPAVPKPVPKPVPPAPKPVPKPAPKKEAVKKPAPSKKPEAGSAEKILFGVLSEYREERKKELKK